MNEAFTFECSICKEPSTSICVWCAKDACPNHLCAKCGRCSDCCECDVPLEHGGSGSVASSPSAACGPEEV